MHSTHLLVCHAQQQCLDLARHLTQNHPLLQGVRRKATAGVTALNEPVCVCVCA
jgi:hypothetical protein